MQHLLLALSIISLTIIAGNGREKNSTAKANVIINSEEKPAVNNVERDWQDDKPSVFFSRFDMFVY